MNRFFNPRPKFGSIGSNTVDKITRKHTNGRHDQPDKTRLNWIINRVGGVHVPINRSPPRRKLPPSQPSIRSLGLGRLEQWLKDARSSNQLVNTLFAPRRPRPTSYPWKSKRWVRFAPGANRGSGIPSRLPYHIVPLVRVIPLSHRLGIWACVSSTRSCS